MGQLQKVRGLSEEEAKASVATYGMNRFDIPKPTFAELFKEHAVAPFFIFQIFCVALWCLDEYWYYSIFTLIMLVIFESTVVWQVGPLVFSIDLDLSQCRLCCLPNSRITFLPPI